MSSLNPFHLAIPVKEITETRYFYRDILGCEEGRSSDHWVDFNFFGHQLVLHIDSSKANILNENSVDGKSVPVPHFGIVLDWDVFENFEKKIRNKVKFIIEPYIRFEGQAGEQKTMFFKDPSGNALEFKTFKNINQLFEK
ncbi:MAG: VOC family protein [Flavobacteriaceae bacterium]|jgi:extradiol dioxygenase family protein|nr:VOC family protein [Flavobacteriaceae bacterium]MBL6681172.1 VOC family protein [Flavobacteriaceae bacterium]|tara:strand:- start:30 stop:449 length:420 start_codon:yes stop_codon:yes gene_type:complete